MIEMIDTECILDHEYVSTFAGRALQNPPYWIFSSCNQCMQRALDSAKSLAIGDWDEPKCPSKSAILWRQYFHREKIEACILCQLPKGLGTEVDYFYIYTFKR